MTGIRWMLKNKAALARKLVSGLACLLVALTPQYSFAIDPAPPAAEAPGPEAQAPQAPKFTEAELEKLLAPIALYPDALLAQLLPASAYPLEIVQAERWLDKNKAAVAKQDFSGGDAQDWDPSVKALLRFPTVVKKLSADLDWTTNLGDAIVNQPQDVANAIQLLRGKAQEAGTLKTTKEQVVTTQKQDGREVVIIESPDPSVVYVPSYDPVAVYNPLPAYGTGAVVAAGLLTFGAAVAIGSAWRGYYWNWGSGTFYPPIWPGYPGWRPPYAGWRPGMPIGGGGNIGNGISDRPWRPDGGRYRPGGVRPASAVGLAAGQASAAGLAAGRALAAAAPTARTPVQDRRHGLRHDLRHDQQQGPGHGGPRRGRERGLGHDPQQDRQGTGPPTSEAEAAATVRLDQVVTVVSVAVSMVAGVVFAVAAEAAFAAADAGPTLGLSTIFTCSAISTIALASTASSIMVAKEPMSGSSLKRCKRFCPMRSHVAGTATLESITIRLG